jgi:Kef-type K+ transport system membrane component KefB
MFVRLPCFYYIWIALHAGKKPVFHAPFVTLKSDCWMSLQIELVLLVLSILFFLSILAGKASSRLGVPALLLFLSVGMLCGSDGLGIEFENIHVAQTIGTIALCIILFSGGMDTKFHEIRPIVSQGIVLATIGVFLTAIFSGLMVWWILGMTMKTAGIPFWSSRSAFSSFQPPILSKETAIWQSTLGGW